MKEYTKTTNMYYKNNMFTTICILNLNFINLLCHDCININIFSYIYYKKLIIFCSILLLTFGSFI